MIYLNKWTGHGIEESACKAGRLVATGRFHHRLRAFHVILERTGRQGRKCYFYFFFLFTRRLKVAFYFRQQQQAQIALHLTVHRFGTKIACKTLGAVDKLLGCSDG